MSQDIKNWNIIGSKKPPMPPAKPTMPETTPILSEYSSDKNLKLFVRWVDGFRINMALIK
jgi:hypothetical protein